MHAREYSQRRALRSLVYLIGVLFGCLIASISLAEDQPTQTLTLSVPERVKPFFKTTSPGVARWIKAFGTLGYDLEFAFYPDMRARAMVSSGAVDGILAVSESVAHAHPNLLQVKVPYHTLHPVLVGRRDGSGTDWSKRQITTIATFLGSTTSLVLPEKLYQLQHIKTKGFAQSIHLVLSKRVDLLVMEQGVFN